MPDSISQLFQQGSFWLSGIGFLLFICFLCGFVLPARRLREDLADLNKGIREIVAGTGLPEKIKPLFSGRPEWTQAWSGFEKTQNAGPDVPATTIVTRAAIIDEPLETGFFKALPGAMVFFGIAGVLSAIAGALLQGAAPLSLSTMLENTANLLSSGTLSALILGLVPVFLSVSATDMEKTLSSSLGPLADELARLLDALNTTGTAETAAAVAAVGGSPKVDVVVVSAAARVGEEVAGALKEILAAQIDRQTASLQSSTVGISGEIVKSIALAMEKPLDRIAQAAERSGRQAEERERALKDTVSSLIRDLGQSLVQTLEKPLNQMVKVVEQSGRQAENVDRVLQSTMSSMIHKIEETFGEQMKGFNALLLENAKSLHDMRQSVAQMMEDLKKNSEFISAQSRSSVEKMDLTAQTILSAAEKFGEAGSVVNSQISHSHSLSRHMMESGMALNASATALGQVVTDYGKARDSIGSLISTLHDVAKGIDQKVTINQSLVGDMQKVADRLKEVQTQTDDYLNKVSGVLSAGFNDFGTSVHENLERSTSTFQTSMGNSVELISVQMRNLTSALQDLPELLRKSA